MNLRPALLAAALLAVGALAASAVEVPAQPPAFTAAEAKALAAGKPVKKAEVFDTREGGRAARAVVYIRIDAPPAAILRTVLDYDRYPEFYPNLPECALYRQEGNVYFARFVLAIAGGIVKIRYHCRHVYDPEARAVTWTLDPDRANEIKETTGFWKAWETEPGRCLVGYSLWLDSGRKVPKFIENLGTDYGLRKVATCMKARVESLARAGR